MIMSNPDAEDTVDEEEDKDTLHHVDNVKQVPKRMTEIWNFTLKAQQMMQREELRLIQLSNI